MLALALVAAPALAAPANDGFAAAEPLSGTSATVSGTNVDATKEPGEPDHADNAGGSSIWYRWTAPASGAFTIDTCGSRFDTLLAVYTGEDIASLSAVGSSDDACDTKGVLTFEAAAGQEYAIVVDGFDGASGDVTLRLQEGGSRMFELTAEPQRVRRPHRLDATRFVVNSTVELFSARLELTRRGRRVRVDLQLEDEGRFFDDTEFQYTFRWLCSRAGRWHWTLRATTRELESGPATRVLEGDLLIPRCARRRWFVSAGAAKRKIRRDFDLGSNVGVRCRAVGRRRGARSDAWRCSLRMAGFRCRGSVLIRARRTFQGGDLIRQALRGHGGARCTR